MPQTILVVDDKTNVRTLLREYLGSHGYRVVTAENGRVALFAARHEKPDLILLDIMMPAMDGFEVLTRRKADPVTRNLPIIVISANTDLKSVVRGRPAWGGGLPGHHRYETAFEYYRERTSQENPGGMKPYDHVLMFLSNMG